MNSTNIIDGIVDVPLLPRQDQSVLHISQSTRSFLPVLSKHTTYIAVDNNVDHLKILYYLFKQKQFKKPYLLLTICGSINELDLRIEKEIKKGIGKITTNTEAWLISDCNYKDRFHRFLEEALFEGIDTDNVPFISFVKLDMNNENMVQAYNSARKVSIDQKYKSDSVLREIELHPEIDDELKGTNKTLFIITNELNNGVKICDLRIKFESELRKDLPLTYYEADSLAIFTEDVYVIPAILIIIQGDLSLLESIYEALKKDVYVLLVADTGKCADFMIDVIHVFNSILKPSNKGNKLVYSEYDLKKSLNEKLEKYSIVHHKQYTNNYIQDRLQILLKIFEIYKLKHEFELVSIYYFSENGDNFQSAVLKSFQNSIWKGNYKNLEFALKIDGYELVSPKNRKESEKKLIDFIREHNNDEKKLPILFNLVETALLANNYSFIEILINMNCFDWKRFLTKQRLYVLYNSDEILQSKRSKGFLGPRKKPITFKFVEEFLREHTFHNFESDLLPDDIEKYLIEIIVSYAKQKRIERIESNTEFCEEEVKKPIDQLFLWCILFQKFELAKLFWIRGEDQISSALFTSKLLKNQSKAVDPDLKPLFEVESKKFERLTIGVMDLFDQNTNNFMNSILLLNKGNFAKGMDNLEMAVECKCRNFVAQSNVQNVLTDFWYFGVKREPERFFYRILYALGTLFCLITFGIFAPWIMMEKKEKIKLNARERLIWQHRKFADDRYDPFIKKLLGSDDDNNDGVKNHDDDDDDDIISKNKSFSYFKRYSMFFQSPRTRFVFNFVTNLVFLIVFTHMMLYRFNNITYITTQSKDANIYETNYTNMSEKATTRKLAASVLHKERAIEFFILLAWVFLLGLDEVRQLLCSKKRSLWSRIKRYMLDEWNYADILGCVLFPIGFILRGSSQSVDDNLFIASRIVLCIDLAIWYIRFLSFFLVYESLGPKLIMVRKMMKDVKFFIMIILIFLFSFGIFVQVNLHPDENLNGFQMLQRMIHLAFWPIFGEIKPLDDVKLIAKCNRSSNADHEDDCLPSSGAVVSYVALMLYMIIANVLLVNLLIAMFNSTYSKVHENNDAVWKFHRYKLVFEYLNYPLLPPPLNIIIYFFDIIKKCCFKKSIKPKKPSLAIEHPLVKFERKFAYECWMKMKNEDQKHK